MCHACALRAASNPLFNCDIVCVDDATRMLYVCVVHAMQMWYVCIVHAPQRWGMCVQMQCECGMRVRNMQRRGGVCVCGACYTDVISFSCVYLACKEARFLEACMLLYASSVPCVHGSKVSLRACKQGFFACKEARFLCVSGEGSSLFAGVKRDHRCSREWREIMIGLIPSPESHVSRSCCV